jgi:hypothetical protein
MSAEVLRPSFLKRAVSAVVTNRALRPTGAVSLRAAQYALGLHGREVVAFGQRPDRRDAASRIRAIVTGFSPQTIGVDEGYLIYSAVRSTEKVGGDLAEVGVFRGQSAKIICLAKGARLLHLFDTFGGLPAPGSVDTAFTEGEYACSLPTVQQYLADEHHVHYYPGLFPETAAPASGRRFSFVHLDVDLYASTRAALEFFYPRLSAGGIIVSHDYVTADGVRQAFDEFLADKPEPVVELTGNQCLVTRLAASPVGAGDDAR